MKIWSAQTAQDLTAPGCLSGAFPNQCALIDLEFAPADHNVAWALSSVGGGAGFSLAYTTQAGQSTATWTPVNLPFSSTAAQPTSITVDPADTTGATVLLSVSGFTADTGVGHIYETFNFGTQWSSLDENLPDVPVLKILRENSARAQYLAGTDKGIYSSSGGLSWQLMNQPSAPPQQVPVYDIAENQQHEVVAGTHGAGLYDLLPDVQFRDVQASPEDETGTGQAALVYPRSTRFGDTVVGFVLSGGKRLSTDLTPPPNWNLIGGANFQISCASGICVSVWVLAREVTKNTPVPINGNDTFTIANDTGFETLTLVAVYSAADASKLSGTVKAMTNRVGTVFTAPSITYSSINGGAVLQWFLDAPFFNSPDGINAETYEDTYGWWIGWMPLSGVTERYTGGTSNDMLLSDLSDLVNGTSYGSWAATAAKITPPGAPKPPDVSGIGYGWSVTIPPLQ